MRNLVNSIKKFYKYPKRVVNLSSFFRYESLQKRFEFCPKGKDPDSDACPVESGSLLPGDYPPKVCDNCIKEYLEVSDLTEEEKKFLYERFSPLQEAKDNSWILVEEDMSDVDARTGKRPEDK